MGWSYGYGYTKRDLIDERTKDWETETRKGTCLARCVRGSNLWTVWEIFDGVTCTTETFIGLDLMRKSPGYGWGSKSMTEASGPVEINCPKKYLGMVPVANQEWRDRVLAHYRTLDSAKLLKKALEPGDRITLVGSTIPEVTIVSVSPFWGRYGGTTYRIPLSMVGERLPADE